MVTWDEMSRYLYNQEDTTWNRSTRCPLRHHDLLAPFEIEKYTKGTSLMLNRQCLIGDGMNGMSSAVWAWMFIRLLKCGNNADVDVPAELKDLQNNRNCWQNNLNKFHSDCNISSMGTYLLETLNRTQTYNIKALQDNNKWTHVRIQHVQ